MRGRILLVSLLCIVLLTMPGGAFAQSFKTVGGGDMAGAYDDNVNGNSQGDRRSNTSWGRDTTSNSTGFVVPIGVTQWTVDNLLGDIIPAENNDTVVHMFQWYNETSGYNGEYSFLGNLGAPRLSRIYLHRIHDHHHFHFLQPYNFFVGDLHDFRFSNTLSPLTNLAYHKVGNKTNGQERLRAYFATNINKVSGLGMKFDYLYGRGYYNSQANSQFGGTLFGYYLGERYNLHAYVNYNNLKMAENGGIEDDAYILDPQSFPRSYGSKDIPTTITDTWNRNQNEDVFLTHRYNLGFYRELEVPDSLRPQMPSDDNLLKQFTDSVRQLLKADTLRLAMVLDSLKAKWTAEQPVPKEFVPVTSIIHTMHLGNLHHTYYAHQTPDTYYTNHFYGDMNNVRDRTKNLMLRNTVGLALREGFNKWAQMGIALYAIHELKTYTLPTLGTDTVGRKRYNENTVYVGGRLSRTQGRLIHYDVDGEVAVVGDEVGNFDVNGTATLDLRISRRDTLQVELNAFIQDLDPDFYFQHYHSQFLWWDNSLSKEFKTRIAGALALPRIGTRLSAGLENVKNYTYYAMQNTLTGSDPASTLAADYSHDVGVGQHGGNIQVFSARLQQRLHFGPFNWENDVTYQTTSNADVLPLPKVTLYSNMFLGFRIAKVLNIELGADLRYFTRYYAPDYSPAIQQFAVQDADNPRIKIGNYPIVGAYLNMHIKHCRLYFAMSHLNAGSGHMFWAPHYPMDPRTFHFGVSWNFFN